MIARFFALLIKNISEEMLRDLVKAAIREIVLERKKGDIREAGAEFRKLIAEIAVEDMTIENKDLAVAVAARTFVRRMRKP